MARSRAFVAWLHRSYMQAGGLGHFISSRITPMGWTLLGAVIFTGLFASDISRSQTYQFFCVLAALTGVALIWTFLRRGKLRARRRLPRFATVGEVLRYEIEVTQLGRRRIRGGYLIEMAPDPRPDFETFYHAREPWEQERNLFDRTFAFYRWRWLVEAARLFKEKPGAAITRLDRGETQVLESELTPERRGVVRLADMRLALPDPAGFFRRLRKVGAKADKVVVLPRRYRLPEAFLEGSARNQIGGEAASNQKGQSDDYVSVRDYRNGDSLRHIHWKGWARTGRPVVMEFEETFFPRYGLILDTRGNFAESPLFEVAVSIAASFAARIDTRECLVELMFLEGRAVRVTAGRGEARSDELLETLAGVEMRARADYDKLRRLVGRYAGQLTSAFLPMAGWDAKRAALVSSLLATGLDLTVFPVFASRQQQAQALAEHPCVARCLPVHLGRVQKDLMRV